MTSLICAGLSVSSVLTAAATHAQGVSFIARRDFAAQASPSSVAVGDFNADGVPDLAVANTDSNSVSVLLGNGDGTFQTAQSSAVETQPSSVAVGDFNGDGVPDLAVANSGAPNGSVSVLLGNGDGSFQTARSFGAGIWPSSVAVGDFNADGVPDLAVANRGSNDVSVLLGNGDGSFQAARSFAVGSYPYSVAVGDFNRDGVPDLAVANHDSNNVSVLLGNGDGSFQTARSLAVGASPFSVAVGDFNADGVADLAVANVGSDPSFQDGGVWVLLGNGDGGFQAALNFGAGSAFVSVAVGDLNGDGVPDLAATKGNSNDVSVLLGNGDGSFQAPRDFGVGARPFSVAVSDFNGDGVVDLAVADSAAIEVSILLGYGDGSFEVTPALRVPVNPVSVAAGDFNGDGVPDLAVVNMGTSPSYVDGTVSVLLGNGDGRFQEARSFAAGSLPSSVTVGDFNGDGVPDLAVANRGSPPRYMDSGVSVLLGNGDGSFQTARRFATGSMPSSIAVGDFNGDGLPDLAVANDHPSMGTVAVLLGNGDGSFQTARSFGAGSHPSGVAVGDFNGDGVPDLAVTNLGSYPTYLDGGGSVLLGIGDGSFQTARSFQAGHGPSFVALSDFNGDGFLDLAVANNLSNDVSVLFGNGDGSFQAAQGFWTGSHPSSVVVSDFNGDGLPDLAVAGSSDVSVLLGIGDGSFQTARSFGVGSDSRSAATGDFNGDGLPDLAVANFSSNDVSVLINNTRP